MIIASKPKIVCDICHDEFCSGQGYGLKDKRSELKYTKELHTAETHICNGCMTGIVWAFEDSVGKKEKLGMRF